MRSSWTRVSLKSHDKYSYKRQKQNCRDRGIACEDKGRDGNNVSRSRGIPRITDSHWKVGEKHGTDSPPEPPADTIAADTLISDF